MFYRLRWHILVAVAGSVVVLVTLGLLATSTGAMAPPYYTKAYVEAVVGTPRQLNPLLQTPDSPASETDLTALLFDGLVRFGPDGTPQPNLAERWAIDPAGTVYTFTLRSSLRWHDGVSLTADDVVFTVRAIQDPQFSGDPALADIWRQVEVAKIDARRVRFTLGAPFAPFLAATSLPILPAHVLKELPLKQWAGADFSSQPIGSGPFRLRQISASQALLVPFEGGARGRPALDVLVLRFYPSTEAARAAFRRREVQGVAWVAAPGVQTTATTPQAQTKTAPLGMYTILTFNLRTPPLDDARLRAALALGLDRGELVRRALGGQGQLLDTPVLPQTWAQSSAALPKADRAASAAALDALGWRRGAGGVRMRQGIPLQLPLYTTGRAGQLALAREIARQWGRMGIDVPIAALSRDDLLVRAKRHEWTLLLNSWSTAAADPDGFALWHSSQAADGANYAGLVDATSDRLLADGRVTTDPQQRAGIYAQWQSQWVKLVPSLPLYQSMLVYELNEAVRPAGLDTQQVLQSPSARFDMISDWTLAQTP